MKPPADVKPCIEVALNGPWGKARQPLSPITAKEIVAEAVACVHEGASIVHLHAYDEATGRQHDDADIYARIIEGIREKVDVIVYPTLPLSGSGLTTAAASPAERFAHVAELARRGLLEMTVVDPGSVNFTRIDAGSAGEPGFIYLNPPDDIAEGLSLCRQAGLRPSYAIYEPGFTRLGAAAAKRFPGLKTPLYRLMFSDQFAWGFPPEPYALEAHLKLLEAEAPGAPWMIAGLGVDLSPIAAEAVRRGGHLRVGLEDAHFGCPRSNRELVTEAVSLVRGLGREPASPADIRAMLASCDQ